MREPASDSSEDLYSVSTITTDVFDFTADTFMTSQVSVSEQTSRFVKLIKLVFGSVANLGLGSLKVSFEFLVFSLFFLKYFVSKTAQLIHFLDVSKDQIVSTLMWRRGLLFRPATHGGVIVVTALAVVAGGLFTRGQIAAQDLTPSESVLSTTNTTTTIVPTDRPRSEVLIYKVEGGDTLSSLSDKFSVSVDTLKWANNISSDTIRPDDTLQVPPVTGVVYRVKEGDTLASVAKAYSAYPQTIADFPFNYIDDTLSLKVGQTLYVPDGSIPRPVAPAAPKPRASVNLAGSGLLGWPVAATISQYFSWFHPAIDIARPMGTPIYAAASGTIIDAKKQAYSFGWYCIQNIGGGYTVAYAHMSAQACYVGQVVARGQYIGAVGMTGRATGPHLHLEVRRNGVAVNPLTLF